MIEIRKVNENIEYELEMGAKRVTHLIKGDRVTFNVVRELNGNDVSVCYTVTSRELNRMVEFQREEREFVDSIALDCAY